MTITMKDNPSKYQKLATLSCVSTCNQQFHWYYLLDKHYEFVLEILQIFCSSALHSQCNKVCIIYVAIQMFYIKRKTKDKSG